MKLARVLPIIISIFLITGCGNDSKPTESTDNTAPTVAATSPTTGATNIAVDAVITATFSEDINPSTIAASTFYLSGGISGTVTYSNKTATLTPSANLTEGHTYTATITTAVKDEAGNALAQNYVWSFTTVYNSTGLPEIISHFPASGASGVPVDVNISATFSEDMDPTTISNSTFFISAINGDVTYSSRTALLDPYIDLNYNTEYTAFVTNGVKDLDGNAMDATYTWTFTTLPDIIMPLVVGNRWIASVSTYDSLGNFVSSYSDTLKIVNTAIIESEQWHVVADGTSFINKADGLYRHLVGGSSHLFLKYPVTLLDSWSGDPDLNEIYRILDADTVITTAAGSFHCILYEQKIQSTLGMYYLFYAPQYGLIQWETFYNRDPLKLKARWVTIDIDLY